MGKTKRKRGERYINKHEEKKIGRRIRGLHRTEDLKKVREGEEERKVNGTKNTKIRKLTGRRENEVEGKR